MQFLQILWLWSYCPRTYQAGICLASLELIRLQSRWVRFFYRLVTSHWFICHLCRALAIATFSKSQVEKDAAESCANSINTSNKPTSSLLHLADLACWVLQLFPFASSLHSFHLQVKFQVNHLFNLFWDFGQRFVLLGSCFPNNRSTCYRFGLTWHEGVDGGSSVIRLEVEFELVRSHDMNW